MMRLRTTHVNSWIRSIMPAQMRKSLHRLYILRPALGTDGFLSRAFIDVATFDAPVLVPFQFIHVKFYGTTNGTHAASPHITPY